MCSAWCATSCITRRGRGTDSVKALDVANHVLHRRAIVFLISDFQSPGDPVRTRVELRRAMRQTNRRHDLIAVQVADPLRRNFPNVGVLALEDAETGEIIELDTGNPPCAKRFNELAVEHARRLVNDFRSEGVDTLELKTDSPYMPALQRFFKTARAPARMSRRMNHRASHAFAAAAIAFVAALSIASPMVAVTAASKSTAPATACHDCIHPYGPAPAPAAFTSTAAPASTSSNTNPDANANAASADDIRDIRGPKGIFPLWQMAALLVGAALLAIGGFAAWRWARRALNQGAQRFEIALQHRGGHPCASCSPRA